MQQGSGSGFGSSSSFGAGASPSPRPSAFGAFTRPPSASTSSAPPNTFARPPAHNASTSAFSSGLNNGQQQNSFGGPRPFNGGPRPPAQQSGFNASRPMNGGQQNRPRPFMSGQESQAQQQAQQQQSTTFGNRPRPFTSRSTGPGMGQEGRPPNGAFRGGRGGGMVRPARPFASRTNNNQPSGPMEDAGLANTDAGPSNTYAARPRPRPFANKSTTFNTQPSGPSSSFNATSGSASNSRSAFGAPASTQNGGPNPSSLGQSSTDTSSFNGPNTTSSANQTTQSFGHGTSAFGSTANDDKAASTTAFGNTPNLGFAPSFGSASASSAFGSSAVPSLSAFGSTSSAFGSGSTFSAFQPQISASPAAPSTTAVHPPSQITPATVPIASAAPTSSFSNFLRKDRNGTSIPGDGSQSPFTSAADAAKSTQDEDELRKKRFEDAPKVGNRFLEMKGGRDALRNAYIKSGVLPDPDKPTDLALAVKLVGTCQDMCPEFEREEREFQKELDPLELYPGTDRVDPRIAVKIYRRPAAGRELPLPEDVRPPPVLKRTLDYLFHDLLPADPNDSRFTAVQGFLWNRTRAVRQDFIVQSEGGPIAIECHERIARYHILCLHWRGGPGAEGWSEQQELEQLRKTMRSLIEFYDDNRRKSSASGVGSGGQQASPNEAEFRAYNLLLHLRDPETLREAELLPGDIFRSPLVQTALNLRQLAQRSNNLEKRGQPRNTEATLNFFSKFFAELRKPNVNYLMACLAENSFSSVRIGAVKAMAKAYMAQHRALPIDRVQQVLGMDSPEQVVAMATHLTLELEYEADLPVGVKIHRSAAINEDKPLATPFSSTIVESKRGSYTCADVVDGRASGARAGMPSTQSGPQASAAGTTIQPFGHPRQMSGAPSFGDKPQQQPPSAFGASTASPSAFGQQQSQQDTSKSAAFQSSSSSSKLSAAASSFTPSRFGASVSSNASPSSPSVAFGGSSSFGGSITRKQDETNKASLPSSGGFGKDASQPRQDTATANHLFGGKIATLTPPASDTEPSSLPNFSLGQPAAKKLLAASSDEPDTDRKPKSSSTLSFSFAAAPKADSDASAPSMPSFFASSLGSKDLASARTGAVSATAATTKPSDSKNDDAVATPVTQKRHASDSEESEAARAAAAAKADAEAKAQAKRKETARAFAVNRAFKTLSEEVVRSIAAKTAAGAVQEEEVRRKAASRNELVTKIADQLWHRLAHDHSAQAAEKAGRVAAAEVFWSRSCAMRAWQRWLEVLNERRDREQQRQRLETIRGEIKRRNILARVQADATSATPDRKLSQHINGVSETSPISHAFSIRQALLTGERSAPSRDASNSRLKRKLGDENVSSSPERRASLRGDAALVERWTRVRRQRNQLWAEGSLLERLADHIEELLLHFRPAELDRLIVLFSGAPNQHVASSWLRVKFGFSPNAPSGSKENESGRDVLEIDLADGSQLELVDVTSSSGGSSVELETILPIDEDHSQAGLVIFETSPAAAQAKNSAEKRKVLSSDRKRLEEIASSRLVKKSHLACRLLVVAWSGSKAEGSHGVGSSINDNDDVEMPDVDKHEGAAQQSLLASLGLDSSRVNRSTSSPALSSAVVSPKPSQILSHAFERIGILELDDASVSIEAMLASLLPRAMPDLRPNPHLYETGPRRPTMEDLVRESYDQWARTSSLLFELLSALPSPLLSTRTTERVERVACKVLQILSALANHVLHTVVSMSETILEDENPAEVEAIEVPSPFAAKGVAGGMKLVSMAISQLDQLPNHEEEQKLHLRSRLLSSLRSTDANTLELKEVLAVVNRTHIDDLFRLALEKLSEVWIGVKPGTDAEWTEARDTLARLCSAAVEEIAAETRAIWAEYRASTTASRIGSTSPSKRVRVSEISQAQTVEKEKKAGKVSELRELVARTRRFLDRTETIGIADES
ncbi:related to SAC3 - leucine permease transcriptional regulator [Ustilago trichophora]|uniref:Related to SAC3 - leucine permease transcriptional regulator n=1 Tax=Ustilago trichophora TaxID=86804 RepID=A0A5C3ES17_9BASI|nr:related to SAC3 - leucine permease transcriptional regulator [Ustilago trichophora]